MISHLRFHLLIWEKFEAKLLVFRDQIGIWPLYYYVDEDWLVISTNLVLIRSLRTVNLSISEEWIADFTGEPVFGTCKNISIQTFTW